MEQDWVCPHCGKKIGSLNLNPPAAAGMPNSVVWAVAQPPTTGANPPIIPKVEWPNP